MALLNEDFNTETETILDLPLANLENNETNGDSPGQLNLDMEPQEQFGQQDIETQELFPDEHRYSKNIHASRIVFLIIAVAALVGINIGINQQWDMHILVQVLRSNVPNQSTVELDIQFIRALFDFGAGFGAFCLAFKANHWKRQHVFSGAGLINTFGWILIILSNLNGNPNLLFPARVLNGAATGIMFAIMPLMLTESAPPNQRVTYGLILPLFQVVSVLFMEVMHTAFELKLQQTSYLGMIISLLIAMIMSRVPCTPTHRAFVTSMRDVRERTLKSLETYRNKMESDIEGEHNDLMVLRIKVDKLRVKHKWTIFRPDFYRALFRGLVMLAIFHGLSYHLITHPEGPISENANKLFQDLNLASIGQHLLSTFSCLFILMVSLNINQCKLFLYSVAAIGGIVLAFAVFCILSSGQRVLATWTIYQCAYWLGPGSYFWIYLSELTPPSTSGSVFALINAAHWTILGVFHIISVETTKFNLDFINVELLVLAGVSIAICVVMIILKRTETRDKSLREICENLGFYEENGESWLPPINLHRFWVTYNERLQQRFRRFSLFSFRHNYCF